ncbi:SDR family oxidoreductase [Paenibacillus agricola]|uniref:SDR family oxidoreductase n=1 Tax=Paenibacillus agricola TaxID=2716264 RepID=A0ABX0IZQ9_9BACL|nr:SDR family oxidoreductase [Paenibacillus agricola]NHN28651.1 SDR family oxidoreductase [Paenibacillus agricola]
MNNSYSSTSQSLPSLPSALPTALVTGSSSGFGQLIALTLAQKGYQVIATMRDLNKQAPLINEAKKAGIDMRIESVELDVTNHKAILDVTKALIDKYGRIDVLVNNAGYAVGGFVEDVPLADWQRQMETNFMGVVAVTKAVLPYMREQGTGYIINISSISGRVGFPGYAPYVASKFAVEGFSEALRLELKPFGVQVVLVEPGAYPTNIWKKGFDTIHTSQHSPYQDKLQAILSYSRKTASQGADPQEVADAVARICAIRYPKLRYAMGNGVSLLLWAKMLLPYSFLERTMIKMLGTTKK